MKRYMIAAWLLLLALTTGCSIDQDYSLCAVDDNCVLLFKLLDGEGNYFPDKIDNVTVVLYDAQNNYILHRTVDRSALEIFSGVKLTVEPGDYRVVCWGNVSAASQLHGLNTAGTFTTAYLETVSGVSGCALYYGPRSVPKTKAAPGSTRSEDYTIYQVHIPNNGVTQKEVYFTRAHRAVKVYVQGYEIHPDYDNEHPAVQLTNVPHRYDFFLNAASTCKHYQTGMSAYTITRAETASFGQINAPIADFADNMIVNIRRSSDNTVLASVNLKQYVEDNASSIDDINEIEILFKFDSQANVTISMPTWKEVEVNPTGSH